MPHGSYREVWEDVPDYVEEVDVGDKKGRSRSSRRMLRRRMALRAPPLSGFSLRSNERARKDPPQSARTLFGPITSVTRGTANYLFEIIAFALLLLRKPLSLILVSYLLTSIILYIYSTLGSSLISTLHPICGLPLLSGITACKPVPKDVPVNSGSASLRQADYPQLMRIQVATFEELLDGPIGSTRLALEIRKAEISAGDLATHVNISGLPHHQELVDVLTGFSVDARRAGRALQLLTAKIRGAVDRIIAWSDYALLKMEKEFASAAPKSSWSEILFSSPSNPGRPMSISLISHFNQGLGALEAEATVLIEMAEASLPDVYRLEEELKTVHAIIAQEEVNIILEQAELLSKFWTRVGGNQSELRRCSIHLRFISQITEGRKLALAHVVRPIETLHRLSAELQALRIRLGEPLRWEETPIPFEIQLQGIRTGVKRLILERERAKARVMDDAHHTSFSAKSLSSV